MPNPLTLLRSGAAAAIAAAALSLSVPVVAQKLIKPQQRLLQRRLRSSTSQDASLKRRETAIPPKIYAAAPNTGRCAWPYHNMFPPCMSTWSGDDPISRRSTHPGVTFDEPWEPWWK